LKYLLKIKENRNQTLIKRAYQEHSVTISVNSTYIKTELTLIPPDISWYYIILRVMKIPRILTETVISKLNSSD